VQASIQQRRTVSGTLVNISPTQLRKYRRTLTCRDQMPPALDGIWPGDQVTVKCACELSYLTAGGSPDRAVVAGSSRVDGSHTFYRPQLTMLVVSKSQQWDEWRAATTWQIELEEV
jgi:hypothetical protein